MKTTRKILSLVMALVLILSMSVMASAATITSTYYHTVTKTATSTSTSVVSTVGVHHTKGTADTIGYTVYAETKTFNTSIFPSSYRTKLVEAYRAEGFVTSLNIAAESGYKTIPASMASGIYQVKLIYRSGSGSWSVSADGGSTLAQGTFTSAPINYTITVST